MIGANSFNPAFIIIFFLNWIEFYPSLQACDSIWSPCCPLCYSAALELEPAMYQWSDRHWLGDLGTEDMTQTFQIALWSLRLYETFLWKSREVISEILFFKSKLTNFSKERQSFMWSSGSSNASGRIHLRSNWKAGEAIIFFKRIRKSIFRRFGLFLRFCNNLYRAAGEIITKEMIKWAVTHLAYHFWAL